MILVWRYYCVTLHVMAHVVMLSFPDHHVCHSDKPHAHATIVQQYYIA
jgi:hypothetical protein